MDSEDGFRIRNRLQSDLLPTPSLKSHPNRSILPSLPVATA